MQVRDALSVLSSKTVGQWGDQACNIGHITLVLQPRTMASQNNLFEQCIVFPIYSFTWNNLIFPIKSTIQLINEMLWNWLRIKRSAMIPMCQTQAVFWMTVLCFPICSLSNTVRYGKQDQTISQWSWESWRPQGQKMPKQELISGLLRGVHCSTITSSFLPLFHPILYSTYVYHFILN